MDEYLSGDLEQAVVQFYHTDPSTQASAHKWLMKAQSSSQAWSFVWELLQSNKSPEVQFFAATTLHTKLIKCWTEIPVDQYPVLKSQLLEAIASHCLGPQIVLNKLCITMSAYILQTIPNHWPNAVAELLTMFQPASLPSVPPERIAWTLLQILIVLPQEFQSSHLQAYQITQIRNELTANIPSVLNLLEELLSTDTSACNESTLEVVQQAVKCADAWLHLGIPLENCSYLAELLIRQAIVHSNYHQLLGISESALEALIQMVTHPETHKYPKTVLQFLDKLLVLKDAILVKQTQEEGQVLQDLVTPCYCLFISMAENHSRLWLDTLLKEGKDRCNVFELINLILQCTSTPGLYPINEAKSQFSFGFWYTLQDELMASETEHIKIFESLLGPVYSQLVSIMLYKSQIPSQEDWSKEDKESFRFYRQDIADTMMYCYNVLRKDMLILLHSKLQDAVTSITQSWQPLESCIHAFMAIAECVEINENEYIPKFLTFLQQLPIYDLHHSVAITTLDAVGAYAEWINQHPCMLVNVIPLLLIGLKDPLLAPSATLALKDISRECQQNIEPLADLILQASQEALESNKLKLGESVRLMYIVGRVLAVLPVEKIINYLNQLLLPDIEHLQVLSSQEPSISGKANILLRLKKLSMLFSSLDLKCDDSINKDHQSENKEVTQPVFLILQRIIPVLQAIIENWHSDENVIQALHSTLKQAVQTLLDDCHSLVPDIVHLVAVSYCKCQHASALELTKQLVLLYGKDEQHKSLMESLLFEVTSLSLSQFTSIENMSPHAEMVEALFSLLTQVLKKNNEILVSSKINISHLFQCATMALTLAELPAVKSSSSFLFNFISQSRDDPDFVMIVMMNAESLVQILLRCIGGECARSHLEPLTDILMIMNKKHSDSLSRWLNTAAQQDGFPSQRVSKEQTQNFVKQVLKERANRRKLQEIVQEFSLLCRGLVGLGRTLT